MGGGGNGKMQVKGYKLPAVRTGFENLRHGMATIVNNTVSSAWKPLKVDLTTHIHTH